MKSTRRYFSLLALGFSAFTWAYLPAQADPVTYYEKCYQLSHDGAQWSKEPQLLCTRWKVGHSEVLVTLQTGIPNSAAEKQIASFQLEVLQRVRCSDCNLDVLGVREPEGSVFQPIQVRFNGTRDADRSYFESGTLTVAGVTYFYKDLN